MEKKFSAYRRDLGFKLEVVLAEGRDMGLTRAQESELRNTKR